MAYVDGFVVPVANNRLDDYRKFSALASKVWRDHGALEYVECIADDVPFGKRTSFPRSVKLKPDETVVFAWIVFKSRVHRDKVNALAMKDPRFAGMDPKTMPMDAKRMIFGGFKPFLMKRWA
jgi:uncharacterized protein YbaA (DUF1428 family)